MERIPALKNCSDNINKAYVAVVQCYANGGKVLVCGNGGSASDSEHIVGELMKGFILKRKLGNQTVRNFKKYFQRRDSICQNIYKVRYLQFY